MSQGFCVEVSTDLEEVRALAAEWHEAGQLRSVIAAGGDGTASAVRNQISPEAPLLPLPFGTECLLARYIRQSPSPEEVCRTVAAGLTVRIDLGRVNSRLFLLMMSVGIDAEVVHRLQSSRTGNITHAAYVKPTLQTIRTYKYPELRVHCDDTGVQSEPFTFRWLLVFNLPCYARGIPFAPLADAADGQLDVCGFQRGHLWHSLRYLWHVSRRKHDRLLDAEFRKWRKFRVEAVDGSPVAIQVDGDRAGHLPCEVEVLPGGLTLVVSEDGARRLGFKTPDE